MAASKDRDERSGAAASSTTELPVRQVILYKHGVGYFERSGQLNAGESARLEFKASEMDDVLKSLTIEEKGHGKVSGLRYDSSEPLERKLGEFPFHLKPGQPLSAVLDQLKGALVELKFGSESVRGTLISGRVVPGSEDCPEREQVTLLLESGQFCNFDLAAAASTRFLDQSLQTQFEDYLGAIASARAAGKRSVYIDSTETGIREIIASCMIPMPVWKSSYRLIFGQTAEPTLEGWAIVDNTTGSDWVKVRLALVSGRPVSFISRLYEPRYLSRATAELPEEQVQAPVLHSQAVEKELHKRKGKTKMGLAGKPVAAGAAPAAMAGAGAEDFLEDLVLAEEPSPGREQALSSIAATAGGRERGDLFEYRFAEPVTVRKNESAMLPFLQQQVGGEKLLIYCDPHSVHPLHAAELTNTTGKTLDGGPITVYDNNAYAGEALIETLKAGDKQLISYGVDLGTRITTHFDSRVDSVREIHLNRGVFTTRSAVVETKTYTIRNVDSKAKTLLIEHPARSEYHLVGLEPVELTSNAYRFRLKLDPDSEKKFSVTEERLYDKSTQVVNLPSKLLFAMIENKDLTDSAHRALERILDQKRKIAATEEETQRIETEIRTLVEDQGRLRQNLESLKGVAGQEQQVQTYAKQLAEQEGQIVTWRDQLSNCKQKKLTLESELNSLIEKMDF